MGIQTISERRCFGGVQGIYSHASARCGGEMRFAVFVPPAILAWSVRKRGSAEYAISGALSIALAAVLLLTVDSQTWLEAARPLPLLMLASTVGWGVAAWRARTAKT